MNKLRREQAIGIYSIICSYTRCEDKSIPFFDVNKKFTDSEAFNNVIKQIDANIKSRGFLHAILDQFPMVLLLLHIFQYRHVHPFKYLYYTITDPQKLFIQHFTAVESSLGFFNILRAYADYFEITGDLPSTYDNVYYCFKEIFATLNRC